MKSRPPRSPTGREREGGSADTDPEHSPSPEGWHRVGKCDPPVNLAAGQPPPSSSPGGDRGPGGQKAGRYPRGPPAACSPSPCEQGVLGARDVLLLCGGILFEGTGEKKRNSLRLHQFATSDAHRDINHLSKSTPRRVIHPPFPYLPAHSTGTHTWRCPASPWS